MLGPARARGVHRIDRHGDAGAVLRPGARAEPAISTVLRCSRTPSPECAHRHRETTTPNDFAMSTWHIARNGEQHGQFEEIEILRRLADGSLTGKDLCWREGMATWLPLSAVLDEAGSLAGPAAMTFAESDAVEEVPPLFLHVSVSKLIVMSVLTFSLYELYWIYRNWAYVKARDALDISPFWRSWFGLFHLHALLRRIFLDKEARQAKSPSFSPNSLATGWVAMIIVSNVVARADAVWAVAASSLIPSFLCLVPAQQYVNEVTALRSPGRTFPRWTRGESVVSVICVVIWTLILIGPAPE